MDMENRLTMSYDQGDGLIFKLGRTFGDVIEQNAKEVPDKPYIKYEDRTITFKDLNDQINVIAYHLIQQGFKKGDKVGICLPDWPEYSLMYYAMAKLGIVHSPISPRYREKEITMILNHLEAKAIIIPDVYQQHDYIKMIYDLIDEEKISIEKVIIVGKDDAGRGQTILYESLTERVKPLDEIKSFVADYLKEHPVDADDLLEVAYTSGTTGSPKGVMQTHNTRIAVGTLNNEAWGAKEDDVMIVMSPLCHSTGSNHAQNGALVGRFTVVYLESWSIERTLEATERFGGTVLIGVPTMYSRIINHEDFKKYDLSTVRALWVAGQPIPLAEAKEITAAFDAQFIQVYGTTECGGNHSTRYHDPLELACGTGGKTIRGMETKIVDQNNNIVPIGEIGEICSRGITRFLGYYKAPELTREYIDEAGWFHTQDLGIMDENGYVKIVGRIKDMVIRGGLNIYTTEMEEIINQHPDVSETYVVGYPDDDLGERTCAFIVPKQKNRVITRDELAKFMQGKIAKYKIPDKVKMIEEAPTNISGKVQKAKLQEMLLMELNEKSVEV